MVAAFWGLSRGGILERHGFDVARLAVEDIIAEEWRVPTVHVFELRLRAQQEADADGSGSSRSGGGSGGGGGGGGGGA
jgi:hypothetical protein